MDAIVMKTNTWPPKNRKKERLPIIARFASLGVPRQIVKHVLGASDGQVSVDAHEIGIRFGDFQIASRDRVYAVLIENRVPAQLAVEATNAYYRPDRKVRGGGSDSIWRPLPRDEAHTATRILAMSPPSNYECSPAEIARHYRPGKLAAREGEQCHYISDGHRCAFMRKPGSSFCERTGHGRSAEVD